MCEMSFTFPMGWMVLSRAFHQFYYIWDLDDENELARLPQQSNLYERAIKSYLSCLIGEKAACFWERNEVPFLGMNKRKKVRERACWMRRLLSMIRGRHLNLQFFRGGSRRA